MKYFILALITLALVGCDKGSVFNKDTPWLTTDATSRMEAAGTDFRVYEFTPQTAPWKTCVFVAGDRKGGLNCFDKENK